MYEPSVVVALAIFTMITILIVSLLNHRIKNKILNSNNRDEAMKLLNDLQFRLDTLKWGLILFFAGLGMIVLEYIPFARNSPLPYGIELVFISVGFLLYYLIRRKK